MNRSKNILIGTRFGKLTVISDEGTIDSHHCYGCKCDCGKISIVTGSSLIHNGSKSCGCSRYEGDISHYKDINVGKKFGSLIVIESIGHCKWKCKCDCENTIFVSSSNLRRGIIRDCGCSHIIKIPTSTVAFNTLFRTYIKRAASRKNQCFNLTEEQFREITSKNCFYCGIPPYIKIVIRKSVYLYNGIDRIDNTRGYEDGNIVPCCIICNRMKYQYSQDKFKGYINRIYNYWSSK